MSKNTNIFDKDINPVLEISSNEDLEFLATHLTDTAFVAFDPASIVHQDVYKKYYPLRKHSEYADLIAKEICKYGGNSFANLWRGGKGPSYEEVVRAVADQTKAPYIKNHPIEMVEDSIIMTVMTKALEKMSDEEKQQLLREMGEISKIPLKGPALNAAFIALFRLGGFKSYQLTLIIANNIVRFILGRGIPFMGNVMLVRAMAILVGPIGWALTGMWAGFDLAGPAYRVITPAVIYIAMLRRKQSTPTPICPHCKTELPTGGKFCLECGGKLAANLFNEVVEESKKWRE